MNSKVIERISDSRFDGVFLPMDNSAALFQKCGVQMVEEALVGTSSTLFVYGGFNSGKTYTLYGDTLS